MQTMTVGPREIREAVTMREAIDAVRGGFIDLAAGGFEMPTRTALRDGRFLVMSAHHRATASAMIKTLSLNFDRAPAIAGTVVWSETGRVDSLVADAGAVTTLRTGAAVGAATDLLAPADASRLTIIGAGGQAPDQVRAVHTVRPLRELTVVDADPRRAEALAETLAPELTGAHIRTAAEAEAAVGDAEIVCCATNATSPLFAEAALPAQVHVNAIGAFRPTMRELPDELLASSTVIIDELEAILEESGEILHALESGAITRDDLTELGAALSAPEPPRGKRTVFKTVGVAMQDWAIARLLADKFLP
ncbi:MULTISPECIES: ornithine cyclodeaminase family protein [Streptomyces]|uniref:ornithine cyclodeaminase family protein n=1 Tax=Streptomyces TaxID=1883 RepID=UPI000997C98A|nr:MULTISPECIES: ornithine cyclodeaminase family protein [Streptomyces]AQW49986.1 ornithine cyclodeaminase [Streptomyces hygroscopicus]ASQ93916.1 ornithine cyclodeaminase [Streptomyces sp. 11-1-2]